MKKRVVILGAGISGLTLAWYLRRRFRPCDLEITIVEKSNRVGGPIKTLSSDGFFFECGPRALRLKSKLPLLEELGLQDAVIEADKASKDKYIVYRGEVAKVPSSFREVFSTPLGRAAVSSLLSYPFRRKKKEEDESVRSFFEKRFGKNFVATFIDPMIAGIWGARPDDLSFRAAFQTMPFQRATLSSFHGGLEILPKTLAEKLEAEILLSIRSVAIEERGQKVFLIHEGGTVEGDMLLSSLMMHEVAPLLEKDPIFSLLPPCGRTSITVCGLGWKEDLLPFGGFGFLTPSQEEKELLGISFDSSIFPQHSGSYKTRLSVLMGGGRYPEMVALSDEELIKKAGEFCSKYLHINKEPDKKIVIRAKEAIAAYPVGHLRRLSLLEEATKGRRVRFFGAGLYGISVPQCIAGAQQLGETLQF
jgi:protoporphyrinogen/coproporphyrinogen III oxidase